MKVPPNFIDGERAILGALLLDNNALSYVLDAITPADFYHDAHRIIYQAMLDLQTKRVPVDLGTLSAELLRSSDLEPIGGSTYLMDLIDAVPSAANVMHYVQIVKEKAIMRRIMTSSLEIVDMCLNAGHELSSVMELFQKTAFSLAVQSAKEKGLINMKKNISVTIDAIADGTKRGMRTGLANLDRIFDGFFPGDMILLAGRPSSGKSALAADILLHVAKQTPAAFFSVEMSTEDICMRLLSKKTGINLSDLRGCTANSTQLGQVMTAAGPLSEINLWIDDSGGLTVGHIRNRIQQLLVRDGVQIGFVVVDYIQLMTPEGKFQSREREIASLSQGIKILAKELNVPILCLSQLSRKCEERQGPINKHPKRPVTSDLRDSGTLEQDADAIMFVYRPEMYSEEPAYNGQAHIVISKQRSGPCGVAKLEWRAITTTFRDPAPEFREDEEREDPTATRYDREEQQMGVF